MNFTWTFCFDSKCNLISDFLLMLQGMAFGAGGTGQTARMLQRKVSF